MFSLGAFPGNNYRKTTKKLESCNNQLIYLLHGSLGMSGLRPYNIAIDNINKLIIVPQLYFIHLPSDSADALYAKCGTAVFPTKSHVDWSRTQSFCGSHGNRNNAHNYAVATIVQRMIPVSEHARKCRKKVKRDRGRLKIRKYKN